MLSLIWMLIGFLLAAALAAWKPPLFAQVVGWMTRQGARMVAWAAAWLSKHKSGNSGA